MCLVLGHRDQAHRAKSLLFGGVPFSGCSLGSHTHVLFRPRFFFLALGACSPTWIARRNLRTAIVPRTSVHSAPKSAPSNAASPRSFAHGALKML